MACIRLRVTCRLGRRPRGSPRWAPEAAAGPAARGGHGERARRGDRPPMPDGESLRGSEEKPRAADAPAARFLILGSCSMARLLGQIARRASWPPFGGWAA